MMNRLLALHRWIGLVSAVFLALASLSGTALLFVDSPGVRMFHARLLAGTAGKWAVDIATASVLLLALTGLTMWWRRKALTVRLRGSWRRMVLDLHNATGLYAFAIILLTASTGLLLGFARPATNLPPPHSKSLGETVDLGQARIRAERALPGGRSVRVDPPRRAGDAIRVLVSGPGTFALSVVYLDAPTGEVLRVDDFRRASSASRLRVVTRALHTGQFAGVAVRILAFVSSISLVVLTLSGTVLWLQRSRRARAATTAAWPAAAPTASSR